MDIRSRSWRVGLTALAWAVLLRLFASGVPERAARWLFQGEGQAFLIYLETGRDVRQVQQEEPAPILEYRPAFAESPPPWMPMPVFSREELGTVQISARKEPDLAALLEQPLKWNLRGEQPTVLILHTHGTESYTAGDEPYEASAAWRTLDEEHNMLSIGAEVARMLNQAGIPTIQDRQLHDHPSYNGSYVDARKSIREYLAQYPSIQLVLDLHRDAAGGARGQLRTLAQVEGQEAAQLMVVLGANHEGYQENLSLGLKLQAQLERQCPGITRPTQLRRSRFNQDLCPGGLLIEVGAAGNTRAEALLAAQQLAKAVSALALGTEEV